MCINLFTYNDWILLQVYDSKLSYPNNPLPSCQACDHKTIRHIYVIESLSLPMQTFNVGSLCIQRLIPSFNYKVKDVNSLTGWLNRNHTFKANNNGNHIIKDKRYPKIYATVTKKNCVCHGKNQYTNKNNLNDAVKFAKEWVYQEILKII